MRNTVVWGLEGSISSDALQSLEKEGLITIKAWIGEAEKSSVVTHNCHDLQSGNIKKSTFFCCDEAIYFEVYKHLYEYINMQSRNFFIQDRPLQEYLHLFNLLTDLFYGILKNESITLIIFANIPHEGPDFILYILAKVVKIKTIIITQSLFPDRFFYTYDMDDYGRFEKVPEYQNIFQEIKLEKEYEKDLFYMKEKTWQEKMLKRIQRIKHCSQWKQERLNTWKKSRQKSSGFLNWCVQHLFKNLSKRYLQDSYYQKLEKAFENNIDLSAKFIYFPLHLQPELTTSALGEVYCDQLLAIEHLSSWIPEDWNIYVKENPKQTHFMRGQYFFERLKKIPKVKCVGMQNNTYDLIRNSQFVATITGTVGWEAISGGKNAVVFGKAWYLRLPGVFQYTSQLSLQDVRTYKIDHKELECQLALLLKRTAIGVVDQCYAQLVPEFDSKNNNNKLASFFKYILAQ